MLMSAVVHAGGTDRALVRPLLEDVELEVSSDRRTGKPIAVKLVKIKAEVLPEERISGQVGPDLHASPFTMLHGYIHPHPVKEHIFSWLCFCPCLFCHFIYVFIFCLLLRGREGFRLILNSLA